MKEQRKKIARIIGDARINTLASREINGWKYEEQVSAFDYADKIISLLPKRVEVTRGDVLDNLGHILACKCNTCIGSIANWINNLGKEE